MAEPHDFPAGLLYETESGFSLGTGDLLFYGVVVGRASMRGAASGAAAGLGVLLGQALNVAWSFGRRGDSVPALPAAVAGGLACYGLAALAAPCLAFLGARGLPV